MKQTVLSFVFVVLAGAVAARAADQPAPDAAAIRSLVETVNRVGPRGAGHREAIAACEQLRRADAGRIPDILAGFDPAGKLSVNWLRGVVEAIAQRELAAGGRLPQAALEQFLANTAHAPAARSLAYDLILQIDPAAKPRLVPTLLEDPSMELRRDGVAQALAQAEQMLTSGNRDEARTAFRRALSAARDLDQIDAAAARLRELGETVDLPRHFGFITRWKLIAPFENTNTSGFDVAYGPEPTPDPTREFVGKSGPVTWIEHATPDPYGTVDLNTALGKFKGAIGYAYAEFVSDRDQDVDFRLGCINGNKLWVNGQLLTANHIYHSGTYIDQYLARGHLKQGKNVILLKIAQNEQTESWAQRWQFQLRVCDACGTAILSQAVAEPAAAGQ